MTRALLTILIALLALAIGFILEDRAYWRQRKER